MSAPTPPAIVEAFAINGDRPLVPVADPGDGTASFDLGYPPITQQPRISGGVPPTRPNTNGILYMATAHLVYQIGGSGYFYSSSFSAKQTGYAAGAVLRSTSGVHKRWLNLTADNTNDPDSVSTNWLGYCPDAQPTGLQAEAPSGAVVTLALGTGIGFLDVTPATDGTTLDSLTGGYDGQNLVITNLHASNSFTLTTAGNFRLPTGGLTLLNNMGARFTWNAGLSKWVKS